MAAQACLCVICLSIIILLVMMAANAIEHYFNPANRTNGTITKATVHNLDHSSVNLEFVPKELNSTVVFGTKEKYEYMLQTNEVSHERIQSPLNNGCVVGHMTYGCCYKFPEIEFLTCVNITYLPHDYGFNLTLRIGDAVFSEEVSLRNPPPICLDADVLIPYKIGKLCVRIHSIDVTSTHVHFCAKLFIEVLIKSIYTWELGCVEIPIKETVLTP